jgi:hypothetical protein
MLWLQVCLSFCIESLGLIDDQLFLAADQLVKASEATEKALKSTFFRVASSQTCAEYRHS